MFPARKEYELTALAQVGPWPFRRRARFFFKYREATLAQLFEFQEKARAGDLRGWTVEFLSKHAVNPLKPRELRAIIDGWYPLWEKLKSTHLGHVEGQSEAAGPSAPFSATLAILSKELGIDPVSFIERYTLAQMREISEGIAWNYREQTKEGRAQNARLLGKQAVAIAKADKDTIMRLEALKKLA